MLYTTMPRISKRHFSASCMVPCTRNLVTRLASLTPRPVCSARIFAVSSTALALLFMWSLCAPSPILANQLTQNSLYATLSAWPFFTDSLPILTDGQTFTAIMLTIKVATLATLSSSIFGISMAWFVAHKRFYGRTIVDVLCALPLVLPPTVLGYYLIVLFGRRGIFGAWLADMGIQLMFSWQGAVVAATVVVFPLVYKSAKAAFESVDHRLEQAARTLGATELRIFFCISIPLAWRGIIAGVVLAFARGMGEFGATLMLAGNIVGQTQTLSLAIYDAFQAGNDAKATVLVIITSLLCMAVLSLAEHVTRPKGARS